MFSTQIFFKLYKHDNNILNPFVVKLSNLNLIIITIILLQTFQMLFTVTSILILTEKNFFFQRKLTIRLYGGIYFHKNCIKLNNR